MATGFNTLNQNIKTIDASVKVLKEDVKVLTEDVKVLKEDVKVLKEDVKMLKEDVKMLKDDVKVIKSDLLEIKGILAVIVKKLGIETNMLTGPAILDTDNQVAFEIHMGEIEHEPQADTIIKDFVAKIFDRVLDRDTSCERAAEKVAMTEANKVEYPTDSAADLEAREALQSKMRRRIGFDVTLYENCVGIS